MKRRGSSMVGVLAAAFIVLALVLVYMFGGFGGGGSTKAAGQMLGQRADQNGITIPGAARFKALDEVCKSNLSQIRLAISIAQTSSGESQPPASLSELHGLGPDMLRCSIEPHEPYNYDPATGKVFCVHPGHLKY